MKTALSRILQFLVGRDRRENDPQAHHTYCACGALKPDTEARELEASPED
jgi:hypothetical protein